MHIVHGTWIPDDVQGFTQKGAFYLWVETDTPPGTSRKGTSTIHPRHLSQTALSTFLTEKLGLRDPMSATLEHTLSTKYFLLPTANGKPSPSFELLRYVEEEEPIEFCLKPWQVCCYQVPDSITTLNEIHFIALHAADDFQLGADILFWHQYSQAIKGVIAKDQYIPALKYQKISTTSGKGKRAKKSDTFELHPGWELLSDTYEKTIQRYIAAMPGVCTAGLNSPDSLALFDKESLLRHFSECLLDNIVTGTPFIGKFDQQIANTLLYGCIYPYRPVLSQASINMLDDYKHWLTWRANLTGVHTGASFTLCFRLEDASPTDIDNWQLHFLVAAKHDPSLKLSLDEYWQLGHRKRAEAIRPFGRDFEKNLLLALGYAARIYPTVWHGLATDQPTGCRLTMEEALAFLRESAWVLEEAGYTVMVPAWWTPQGRRRTKVRLKTSLHSPKGTAATSQGHLSLQKIIAYEYQLSVGGEVVTEEEWQQLVNAKTPLVQFRGQWMELDRDKMQQMLEFWQKHQHETPEISLLNILKMGAESEDDLEWDHDQNLRDMLSQLFDKSAFAPIEDPQGLQGTLRDYQRRGVAWLQYLENLGLNPCLADDMGQRFITALEQFTDAGRLGRGRYYASGGRILEHTVANGTVTAKVRGSINPYFGVYKEPIYRTTITLKAISSTDWKKAIQQIASRADLITKLLMNEMPDTIEDAFSRLGLHLLPHSKDDFVTECSCPDYANPCKHIAGLYYLLASALDRDPFVMFELRGLSREDLHAELLRSPLGQILASSMLAKDVSVEPVDSYYTRPIRKPAAVASHKEFWTAAKRLPAPLPTASQASVPALLIKKQGDYPPFWHKDASFIGVMEDLYDRVRTKSPQMK